MVPGHGVPAGGAVPPARRTTTAKGDLGLGPIEAPLEERQALRDGRAFADLSAWRKVRVTGGQARSWLGDLVTCDVVSLAPGGSRRSLLLTPTGRIRADFSVACDDEGFLLLQAPDQPDHVGLLLSPYLLSSDVGIEDATNALSLFAVLGSAAAEVGHPGYTPSVAGGGIDLATEAGKPTWRIEDALVKHALVEVGPEALEVARIWAGLPRLGMDYQAGALPAEVGLEWAIDETKGCFLGQESTARVRNFGRPPRMLRHLETPGAPGPGTSVRAADGVVGTVTSAARDGDRVVVLATIDHAADEQDLRTDDGAALTPVGHAG
jgi:tRNA-modifying protein YgfZ